MKTINNRCFGKKEEEEEEGQEERSPEVSGQTLIAQRTAAVHEAETLLWLLTSTVSACL